MRNGIVIYTKKDSDKNKSYINWLIDEGKSKNLNIKLVLDKDISNLKDTYVLNSCNDNYEVAKDLVNLKYTFAINRSRNFNITQKLEEFGVRVFNKYKFCVLGNDKLKAYDYVESLGIKYPKVYRFLDKINMGGKIIEKPRNGHGGENIKILKDFDNLNFDKNVYQEYIEDYIGDIRFYIIDNKIEHAVIRIPQKKSLVSNFTKGGNVEIYNYSNKEEDIINKILKDISIDFGGIDFLLLKNGEILFNEFEDAVGSRMLSYLGINNTMEKFLNYIVGETKGN